MTATGPSLSGDKQGGIQTQIEEVDSRHNDADNLFRVLRLKRELDSVVSSSMAYNRSYYAKSARQLAKVLADFPILFNFPC